MEFHGANKSSLQEEDLPESWRGSRSSSASQMLPDDVLAEVLSRLAPRSLALSRGVCKAWRALIDGRRLLRKDRLPLSMAGIFINYNERPYAQFLSPSCPCTELYYFPPCRSVVDHCNGLLLLVSGVLNPATGQWVPLPEPPLPCKGMERITHNMYLVFDPFVSSDFKVFLIRRVPDKGDYDDIWKYGTYRRLDPTLSRSEWPPSPCILDVFSSMKGRWEKRSFHREGQAVGTIASMQLDPRWIRRLAVYWKGMLYVHCEKDFIMRISLSNSTYQLIKPPSGLCEHHRTFHLGKSEKGVYYALLDQDKLQVWILEESRGHMQWILKHDTGHGLLVASLNCVQQVPWILLDINRGQSGDKEELVSNKFQWNSHNDNIPQINDSVENCHEGFIEFLGFHPFKEIVFWHRSLSRVLAYHLNSFEIEDLGNMRPIGYDIDTYNFDIRTCYPYTPCKIGESDPPRV